MRKTTELEKKLENDGWSLNHKTYDGAHSRKTKRYVYYSQDYHWFIELDVKREKVVSYGFLNVILPYFWWTLFELYKEDMKNLKNYIDSLSNNEEPVKCFAPNSEYDEREELGGMTFEQFDELCQEKEGK